MLIIHTSLFPRNGLSRGRAKGIEPRPRDAPPPAPPRSFLAERGEFDRASMITGAHRCHSEARPRRPLFSRNPSQGRGICFRSPGGRTRQPEQQPRLAHLPEKARCGSSDAAPRRIRGTTADHEQPRVDSSVGARVWGAGTVLCGASFGMTDDCRRGEAQSRRGMTERRAHRRSSPILEPRRRTGVDRSPARFLQRRAG
jgi:hypothetical protein